ncbi:plasmid partitioning protein RepB [Methylobacterium indicum]|uniref:Plasmid partitioning protein RepB n=1 Tax=Methylobacterium indicum TaxID=1775910 RepID=A0A8H8WZN7_9HYPH|nr:plasmid partitioning protein RepB [Methylobacterium indicum]BCM87610.1 plasmid partitioning protein RepB [Methylobacterium indicum]
MSRKSSLDAIFQTGPLPAAPSPAEALEASNRPSDAAAPPLEASNPPPIPRIRSGALAAMGSALEHLASRAEVAEQIETGSAIVELDAELLDGSFVADRVSDATDPTLDTLVESIRESGQQVPILVRPHPSKSGRYQIAFGHRRARACRALKRPVRAVVRPLTDAELVVAQGKENLDRRNLSYIERAFFAFRLEALTFPRDVICAAMGVHKPDVSNYITVARTVPEHVVAAIGPAPKAGGPRWRALAERIKTAPPNKLDQILADPSFQGRPTDERFVELLEALSPKAVVKKAEVWKDQAGRKLARVERGDQRFTLSLDEKLEPTFGDYLLSRLAELLADFKAGQE